MPQPPDAPSRLRRQQYAFAAHLRDPAQAQAPPGIEDRRLAIYRDLFYKSLEGLLASNYPVIRRLYGDRDWHRLVRDFYREHRCTTPLFPEIGREFLRYLQARQQRGDADPPWLQELAHYEWVELALSLDETDLAGIACDPSGDLMASVPVASPLAWPLAYRFPVHQLRPEFLPEAPPPEPTFLLVVRGRDDAVRFKAIGALGFRLMQVLHENRSLSGRAVLERLAAEAAAPDADAFAADAGRLLGQLHEREAVLGTREPGQDRGAGPASHSPEPVPAHDEPAD
ncbi:MAG TPA: putative DNA-binding domain-containing protein [Xanthomonadaceae bacterium]|nr:putative DNA-binding domain-containing protein [Xanthomonadaceae bacterium]